MADRKHANMIEGVAAIQALRRSGAAGVPRRPAESAPARSPAKKKTGPDGTAERRPAHIGRTALPDKFHLICYNCSYGFTLSGRIPEKTICPKCRKTLVTHDYTIDGAWDQPLQTVGTVTVNPKAVLSDNDIVARRLIVAGDARKARLQCQHLEMGGNGKLDLRRAAFQDLTVLAKARTSLSLPIACRSVTVQGKLTAKIRAEKVVVGHGGHVRGEIHTPRLELEDGAALAATLRIVPSPA